MSISRVQRSIAVCTLLGAISTTAHAQVSPAPGGNAPAAPGAPGPADRGGPPSATPPSGPAAQSQAPGTTLEPIPVQAARAKAAGLVIEAPNDTTVEGCRDLGDMYVDTAVPEGRGRVGIRNELKAAGRARGASHVRYTGHITIKESGAQREYGHFYDCSVPVGPATSPAEAASGAFGASGASDAGVTAHASQPVMTAISGHLELVPVGTLHGMMGTRSVEVDTSTTFGVSGNIEAIIGPYFAIGANPGVVLGLKTDGGMSSATQVDLRGRMRVGKMTGDGFGPYGYLSAGGSWIILPNDDPTSAGASFGFGVGVNRRVEAKLFVTFEIGFQIGFQNETAGDVDSELSSRLFHLGFGFGGYL